MRKERHRRGVERALRDAVRRDRARTKILRTSPFGLIEMTRQRIRPSLKRSVYKDCDHCRGTGVVKTPESMAIEVVRFIMLAGQRTEVTKITVTVKDDVATYLNNKKRREIAKIEDMCNVSVQILSREGVSPEHLAMECLDETGREIRILPQAEAPPRRGHPEPVK
jgi:ribonuclease E